MEQFLVLDSRVSVTWTCDYGLCLGTKQLLLNTHPSQGHMEEFKTKRTKNKYSTAWSPTTALEIYFEHPLTPLSDHGKISYIIKQINVESKE